MARPQINVRVTEEKKQRWKEAAESAPKYKSLTHLIELAVEKELSGETYQGNADTTSLDEEAGDLLREVAGTTERVEGGLTEVKARLRQLEQRAGESRPKFSLRAAVRETLPERPTPKTGKPDRPDKYGLTAKEIAARLDANESDVQNALDTLTAESPVVEGLSGGSENETHYFHTGEL